MTIRFHADRCIGVCCGLPLRAPPSSDITRYLTSVSLGAAADLSTLRYATPFIFCLFFTQTCEQHTMPGHTQEGIRDMLHGCNVTGGRSHEGEEENFYIPRVHPTS